MNAPMNQEPSFRKRIGYHATLLGGIALLTSAFLVAANLQTKDKIKLRKAEDMQASLAQVIPADLHDNNLLDNTIEISAIDDSQGETEPVTVYQALQDSKVVAVAFQLTGQGYAGPIQIMMGLNQTGEILGVRVISHLETPGLGDRIEAKKSNWILGFTGLSIANPGENQWKVKKDGGYFDQFSGATITPRAVVKTIKRGLNFFDARRNEMLEIQKSSSAESDRQQGATPGATTTPVANGTNTKAAAPALTAGDKDNVN
jgi:electron transport complex protein RnfG